MARIRTTHTGSLPRPEELVELLAQRLYDEGEEGRFAPLVRETVDEVVARQREIGLDIVSDGEMSRPGFSNYILRRFSGFGTESVGAIPPDLKDFRGILRKTRKPGKQGLSTHLLPECVGPIESKDTTDLETDIANLLTSLDGASPEQAFMTAVTPGQITWNFPNRHYGSHEEYLFAAAEAMRAEYQAITDAGLMLQLDAPELAMGATLPTGTGKLGSAPKLKRHLEMSIEALNHAVAEIPAERMRMHLCWGNYIGPHHLDIPLAEILPVILGAKPAGIVFEAANPRHAHEWEVFEEVSLAEDTILVPGMIDVKTQHIEHPRLIAQRLDKYASIVGPERVIAGTDCGFSTFAGQCHIDHEVVWAKLAALVEGARLAV